MTAKELTETSSIPPHREQQAFAQVVEFIRLARERAMTSVNTTLIDLHWQVGEFISQRIDTDGWGTYFYLAQDGTDNMPPAVAGDFRLSPFGQ